MEILFNTNKLAKICNTGALLRKTYGAQNAEKIQRRLFVLASVPNLASVPTTPPDRCHALKGERIGCYAIDALHPFRIVFQPYADGVDPRPLVAVDKVTAVLILEIVDYH